MSHFTPPWRTVWLGGYDICDPDPAAAVGKGVLLVAVTGWGQEQDKRRTLEAGFDHHLTKPVELEISQKLLAGLGESR